MTTEIELPEYIDLQDNEATQDEHLACDELLSGEYDYQEPIYLQEGVSEA